MDVYIYTYIYICICIYGMGISDMHYPARLWCVLFVRACVALLVPFECHMSCNGPAKKNSYVHIYIYIFICCRLSFVGVSRNAITAAARPGSGCSSIAQVLNRSVQLCADINQISTILPKYWPNIDQISTKYRPKVTETDFFSKGHVEIWKNAPR